MKHYEETGYPNKLDCAARIPLAPKLAEAHDPCFKLIRHTELMEGLRDTYSESYDIGPRRKERLVDWFTNVITDR